MQDDKHAEPPEQDSELTEEAQPPKGVVTRPADGRTKEERIRATVRSMLKGLGVEPPEDY